VLALTDEAGNVLERYEYADYGAPTFLDSKGAPILAGGQPVHASPLGNPFLFHGMFWDSETGFYCAASKLTKADAGRSRCAVYMDPDTGQNLSRTRCDSGMCADGSSMRAFEANSPWTAEPVCMKKGTVKFFNETKGFVVSGLENTVEVLFNPKEYTLRKVTVRGWNPEKKEEIVGEEGGRHTPFHNKYRPQMNAAQNNPMYQDSGMSGENPLYERKGRPGRTVYSNISFRTYRPGRPVFGNITFEGAEHMSGMKVMEVRKSQLRSIRGRTVGAGQVVEIIK
jgi:hypothetical protein